MRRIFSPGFSCCDNLYRVPSNSGIRHPQHEPNADRHRHVRPGAVPVLLGARRHHRHIRRWQADDARLGAGRAHPTNA